MPSPLWSFDNDEHGLFPFSGFCAAPSAVAWVAGTSDSAGDCPSRKITSQFWSLAQFWS